MLYHALHQTLNLPDSVNKCKTDIKTYLWCNPLHGIRTGSFPRLPKYVSVLRELPNKLAIHENP